MATSVAGPHQQALDLYKQHKYDEAIALFKEAAKHEEPASESFKESALLIGQSYFLLSRAAEAIPWLERIRSVNEANYMLGYAYIQTNRLKESREAFARLFGVAPDSAAGYLMSGQMMMKKGYEEQAQDLVAKAVELDSKLPQAHFVLGEVAIFRGDLGKGIAEMTREIEVDPSFAMAWYRRGDAYTRQEKWDTAIPDLQRAVWLNPDFSGPYILLGRCYFKKADYINAEGILRKALDLDPSNSTALYLFGQTLILEGKKEEGSAALEKFRTLQR